jgi:hypothetical protein
MEPGAIIHTGKPLTLPLPVGPADIHSSPPNLLVVKQDWIVVQTHSFTLSTLLVSDKFNPLNTKRRQLYLKTQVIPRSKHFSYVL